MTTVLAVVTAAEIGVNAVIVRTGHHAAATLAARMAPVKAAGEAAEKAAGAVVAKAVGEDVERVAGEAVVREAGLGEASEGVTGNLLHRDSPFIECPVPPPFKDLQAPALHQPFSLQTSCINWLSPSPSSEEPSLSLQICRCIVWLLEEARDLCQAHISAHSN